MFGTPDSILATIDHDRHRRRRNAYSNYFSKQSIRKYSNIIQSAVDKLCDCLREDLTQGRTVNLVHAYSAMAGDVVSGYCFPDSYHLLDKPGFAPEFSELWKSVLRNGPILKQFPWLFPTMLKLPMWFIDRFLPDLALTYQWQRTWTQQIEAIRSGSDSSKDSAAQFSIFRTLLDSDLPPHEKSTSRLVQDAQTVVGAGAETTARTLAIGTYHILSNKPILDKLLSELTKASTQPSFTIPLAELEQLSYLTAIILETLRLSCGVTHRLQRVCPDQALHYSNYALPPGTPISMTSLLIHYDASIFPDPHLFDPERWLPLETEGKRLQKYLVAFSKGSRQCLGMNLAWADLYMGIAGVIGRFGEEMRVVETRRARDVDLVHDYFTGLPTMGSKGIRVRM